MYEIVISRRAERPLDKLDPQISDGIVSKIYWLAENVDAIGHERLKGHKEYSLHFGQYRVLYTLDRTSHLVIIEDIGRHDEVYRRLGRS